MRQGCILSPLLFNIYAENIMREALEEWESGISIGGRMVTNLIYADDTTLLAGTNEYLMENNFKMCTNAYCFEKNRNYRNYITFFYLLETKTL